MEWLQICTTGFVGLVRLLMITINYFKDRERDKMRRREEALDELCNVQLRNYGCKKHRRRYYDPNFRGKPIGYSYLQMNRDDDFRLQDSVCSFDWKDTVEFVGRCYGVNLKTKMESSEIGGQTLTRHLIY